MRVSDLKRHLESYADNDFVIVTISNVADVMDTARKGGTELNDAAALLVLLYASQLTGNHEEEIETALDELFDEGGSELQRSLCRTYAIPFNGR